MRRRKKGKVTLIVIILAFIVGVGSGFLVYDNSNYAKAKRMITLGEKYLSEMKYKEAAAMFESAIRLDENNSKALEGIKDTYDQWEEYLIEHGQYDEALHIADLYEEWDEENVDEIRDRVTELAKSESNDADSDNGTIAGGTDGDPPEIDGQTERVEYTKEELQSQADELCDRGYVVERAYEDMDGDGRKDLILESGRTTEDHWTQYFVYSDGIKSYKFGEHECWTRVNEEVDNTNIMLIPKQNGGYFMAVTNAEWPRALAAYMPVSAIYNITDDGAEKIYEQELCIFTDPGPGKITANYTYLLMGDITQASSTLTIADDGSIKGNLILDKQMELYYEDANSSDSDIISIGDSVQSSMKSQDWVKVIETLYNNRLAEWVKQCNNKRRDEYIGWSQEVMILPTSDNEGVVLNCTYTGTDLETIKALTRDPINFNDMDVYVGAYVFFNQGDRLVGGLDTYLENSIIQYRTIEHDILGDVYYLDGKTLVFDGEF